MSNIFSEISSSYISHIKNIIPVIIFILLCVYMTIKWSYGSYWLPERALDQDHMEVVGYLKVLWNRTKWKADIETLDVVSFSQVCPGIPGYRW